MKTLSQLLDTQDPCWPLIQDMIARAVRPVRVLPRTLDRAEAELVRAQVTTRSTLGAFVYETGGMVVDGGWLRFLGSGSAEMDRSVMGWNYGKTYDDNAGDKYILVADDAIGGFFAANLGRFGKESFGHIHYLAPDTLEWENLGVDLISFVNYAVCGELDTFYESNRWPGWQAEAAQLPYDKCISIFPPLWTEEVRQMGIENATRRTVSVEEKWSSQMEMAQTLNGSGSSTCS